MAELKTKVNDGDVVAFIDAVPGPEKRRDAQTVLAMMAKITRRPAKMWGPSIVGFGSYHYRYASGREGDMMLTGFSPRKNALTLYIMRGFTIDGILVDFDANGWPSSTAAGVNYCMDIWGDVFHAAEPVVPYVAGGAPEAWSALRFNMT